MDTAADGLLALSNTAAALADDIEDQDIPGDNRSSSLSELEDGPDDLDDNDDDDGDEEGDEDEDEDEEEDEDEAAANAQLENESEAETERLEESPEKLKKPTLGLGSSKLVQSMTIDERPEIEALTASDVSSPISPLDSDIEDEPENEPALHVEPITNKRKRLSDLLDHDGKDRIRRRRTGSVSSDDEKDADDTDAEDAPTREGTVEPNFEGDEALPVGEGADQRPEPEQIDTSDEGKGKKPTAPSRVSRRRANQEPEINERAENEGEESEEEAEVDDGDVQAKSEEEQARRAAAMESLTALEQHFAALRDRLYDERIAQINHELVQLQESEPVHPELVRQVDCVRKWRDQKFDVVQRRLVYQIEALKTESLGRRSIVHSQYFQTVRDVREKHLERISEQFYRIQRDRFKSASASPAFTIPFPERRSQRILHQTAYNKEVSILSGLAKYVGFPSAPELSAAGQKQLEKDLEKMGISLNQVRAKTQRITSTFDSEISAKAAEHQFLEQTPWANPQHPVNRINMSRQVANKSPFNESLLTPASQQKVPEGVQTGHSASTIAEYPSLPASSNFNTPADSISLAKAGAEVNSISSTQPVNPASPSEARKILGALNEFARVNSQPDEMPSAQLSSPLMGRAQTDTALKRTGSVQPSHKLPRSEMSSPFMSRQDGVAATSGISRRVGVQ